MTDREQTRLGDAALIAAWVASLTLVILTLPVGRPVNDDYWALGTLNSDGFWGSLGWYYLEFQGNVTSWLFILLHQLPWLQGVFPWGSAASIFATLALLAAGSWGALTFLGVRWTSGWRFWAALTIVTVIAWLSLTSIISPNSMTLVFYMPSTIVHVWPWCIALLALGLASRAGDFRLGWLLVGVLGFLAGNLGLVEAVLIASATLIVGVFAWKKPQDWPIPWRVSGGWIMGLAAGLAVQFASPATWGRGSGLGSDSALTTNIDAVNRILTQADAALGPSVRQHVVAAMDIEAWARTLVPVAVVGDLLLRPGIVSVFFLAAWWANRHPEKFVIRSVTLRSRLLALTCVILAGILIYSASGAAYAYSGRHVAGLALVVTALFVGLGLLTSTWWADRESLLKFAAVASLFVVVSLAVQQVSYGWTRAAAWDEAITANRALLVEGRLEDLIDVPLKAGISQSGLRDHEGAAAYVAWLRKQL